AQLCHWRMAFQEYNGDKQKAVDTRKELVSLLSRKIQIPNNFQEIMRRSADALDAVLCAFAAIAVTGNRIVQTPTLSEEGQIAVHD
ncbi:MAG: DUF429 domain-containing protein, partial [Xanthobacteraceae bacterium]